MKDAINLEDQFTDGEYNILRVVAAFPLDVNFDSTSKKVQESMEKDVHALAKLSQTAFTAELATSPDRRSLLGDLREYLKRSRDKAEGDRRKKKESKRV